MAKKRYPLIKTSPTKKGSRVFAEEVVAESQRMSHSGSWSWDLGTGRVWITGGMAHLVGMPPKKMEMDLEAFTKFLHPDEAEKILLKFQQCTKNQDARIQHQLILANGESRKAQSCVRAFKDRNGVPTRLLGITWDYTDHQNMDQAYHESEERYRVLVSNTPVVIFVTDENGIFSLVEGKGLENMGLLPGQGVGLSAFEVYRDYPTIMDSLRKALAGQPQRTEVEVQGITFDVHFSCIIDTIGHVLKVVGIATDITSRVQTEKELLVSEEKYRFLIENMHDVIWQAAPDLRITYISPAVELQGGYKVEEVRGRSIFDFMTPGSRNEMIARASARKELMEQGEKVGDAVFEIQQIRKDGSLFWTEVSTHPILDAAGRLVQFHGVTRDVTERRRMEQALRESEARNHALVHAIPDLMFIQDRTGVFIDYHGHDNQLLVAPPEFFLGRTTREVLPPDQVDALQSKFDLAFQSGDIQTHEYLLDVPGGRRYFETRMTAYSDDRLLSLVRDITERKQTEQKLFTLEEFQRNLLNASNSTSIFLLDTKGTILVINELGAQYLGMSQETLVGRLVFDAFPKTNANEISDAQARQAIFEECYRTAAPVFFEDSRNGRWFENRVHPILDKAGQVVQVAVYSSDITERKRSEELLSQSEQRYRALAEASHDMIFMIDREDRITYVNSYASSQLGMKSENIIGKPRAQWFETSNSEEMRTHLTQVFNTDKPDYLESEIVFLHSSLYLSTWLIPIKGQNGPVDAVLGVSRDISGLKKMEKSLMETNLRLEARVEERTAELLESRNLLRNLTQQIVMAQEEERRRISRELHDEAGQALIGLRFNLDSIYKEIPADLRKLRRRMAKALVMTDQTFQLIRSVAHDLRPVLLDLLGLNLGIKELCREFSGHTGLKLDYSGMDLEGLPEVISISLYRFVQEALTNVVKHAGASRAWVLLEHQDEFIIAIVKDNGQGISGKNENKGLGMVGIKERIYSLGGRLEVGSVKPRGTQFKVSLPWKSTVT